MLAALLEKTAIRKQIFPISVEHYHRLGEIGAVAENTELIDGLILQKMSKSPLHAYVVHALHQFFSAHMDSGYWIRQEAPLTLVNSEPEPDISIVRGQPEQFKTRHPSSAELVIEVAVSTVELDRAKASIYAAAGIAEYWIVLPEQKKVEVYRQPQAGRYLEKKTYSKRITVLGLEVELGIFLE